MDSWCKQTHGANGLIDKCRISHLSEIDVEAIILEFLNINGIKEKESPLCGNSIVYDRILLMKYMPRLNSYLHYRSLDVSSFKVSQSIWSNDMTEYKKVNKHSAYEDIIESIEEFKIYINNIKSSR